MEDNIVITLNTNILINYILIKIINISYNEYDLDYLSIVHNLCHRNKIFLS